jgi:aminoglycoside phosphotransferase (APT) family kinase protein
VREAGIRAPAVEGLVEVQERRIDNLQIPPEMTEARSLRDEVAAALARRPHGEAVCHGDLHPGNVIMSPQGPVIIDWIDASRGDPLADVARSVLLLRHSVLPREMNPVARGR